MHAFSILWNSLGAYASAKIVRDIEKTGKNHAKPPFLACLAVDKLTEGDDNFPMAQRKAKRKALVYLVAIRFQIHLPGG